MLSYIYDMGKKSNDAFNGVSSATKKDVKKFVKAIKSWDTPTYESGIAIDPENSKATWDYDKKVQTTQEITVNGTAGNSIQVEVPKGTTLIKDGEKKTSGTVTIGSGESFHLTAPDTVTGEYESPLMTGSVPSFQPYIITLSKTQDMMYGVTTPNTVSYKVTWSEFGRMNLIKKSSDTSVTEGNDDYSLEGAEYELCSASDSKACVTFVTDENGQATEGNIAYGDYYLKEVKAPKGYSIDSKTYSVTIDSASHTETVEDAPAVEKSEDTAKTKTESTTETQADSTTTADEEKTITQTESTADQKTTQQTEAKAGNDKDSPSTGDNTRLLLLAFAVVISLLCGTVAILKKN